MPTMDASADAPSRVSSAEGHSLTAGLCLIIAFKALTAALLWAAFGLLLYARSREPSDFFSELVRHLFRGNPPGIAIRYIVHNTSFITRAMVTRVALGTAVYALLESIEAGGLLLRKAWAEWLVVLVTVSFIPLELFELAVRPMPLKALTLAANLLILGYLLRRLLGKRAAERRAILQQV